MSPNTYTICDAIANIQNGLNGAIERAQTIELCKLLNGVYVRRYGSAQCIPIADRYTHTHTKFGSSSVICIWHWNCFVTVTFFSLSLSLLRFVTATAEVSYFLLSCGVVVIIVTVRFLITVKRRRAKFVGRC